MGTNASFGITLFWLVAGLVLVALFAKVIHFFSVRGRSREQDLHDIDPMKQLSVDEMERAYARGDITAEQLDSVDKAG